MSRRLRWKRTGTRSWETEEQLDGTPDFAVEREKPDYPPQFRLKMRSSRKPLVFETLREAKDYAETV